MARYCGDRNSEHLIVNASEFKETCLIQGKSVLTNESVWTSVYCDELIVNFVENIDEGDGDFFEKLETQLANTSSYAKVLVAEMLWLMFLCPSNTGHKSKRISIERVFAWSGFPIEENKRAQYLSAEALEGIGSAGTAYNTLRWRELVYFIRFTEAFLMLERLQRTQLLNDHISFSEWLEQLPENESRQLRHMLLFLFFPDFNERIFGNTDRRSILLNLTDVTSKQYRNMKCREIDSRLLDLRRQFEQEFGTADIDYYVEPLKTKWKSVEGQLVAKVKEPEEDYTVKKLEQNSSSLNQILYGPPGTGKTYNTINKALAIVEPAYLKGSYSREELKAQFDYYVKAGQIVFTTFHQSFSYEDFVEGLKAESKSGSITYKVEGGIFKEFCRKASSRGEGLLELPVKTSNLQVPFSSFVEELITEPKLLQTKTGVDFHIEAIEGTKQKVSITLSSGKTYSLDIKSFEKAYHYSGIWTEIANHSYIFPILTYLEKRHGLQKEFSSQLKADVSPDVNSLPYVLIIDEINRGNISNIFGELITLIEPSKRAGGTEALSVELPYSKKPFSVPSNLHIIGTMNTADKSLAQVDIALRRRFEFVEMMPDSRVLKNIPLIEGIVDIPKMLETINQRIELLYDREHTIGHSFFLPLEKDPTIKRLARIFELEILPLLEEYFFEDWERVGQVLGDHIKSDPELKFINEKFTSDAVKSLMGKDWSHDGIKPYQRNKAALDSPEAYKGIYDSPQG
ncbi:McrB family protein [Shewanella sp. WPAGA9]|uniref:McrB family protein n=1 Tax=Shewanella sp. ENK2 TaxID=2775245 RepID=UPI001782A82D|nr:AAA family ATPase [Shewanella sp. WPAGA9]